MKKKVKFIMSNGWQQQACTNGITVKWRKKSNSNTIITGGWIGKKSQWKNKQMIWLKWLISV